MLNGGGSRPRPESPFRVIRNAVISGEVLGVEATSGIVGVAGSTRRLTVHLRSLAAYLRSLVPAGTTPVVLPVCAAGVGVLALALSRGLGSLAVPLVALILAATLAEAFPVPIEGVTAGATSFANVFVAAAAALYGWRSAVLVGALAMLLAEFYRRAPAVKLLFNSSVYVLSGAAAGLIAQSLSARYRTGLISSLAFYLVDVALLSAVVACSRKERYVRVARSFFLSTLAPFVVMAATTAILVQLWRESPYWGLLLAPPLVAIIAYQRSLVAMVKRQRELDELKDEFIAVISHELRTPLASVYGGAVTLEERDVDEETRRRLISIIRRESARLAKLVNDVLWASRLDARKMTQRQESCDAAALVREVASTAAEIAPENVSIVVDANGGLSTVTADPEQIQRVLANLIDNAVKYSPEGGRVEVAAQRRNGHVRFTVKDEGIGIPEEEREHIFEKFTRLDPEMRHGIGGTGLGLYICHELVGLMGGTIWVTDNQARGSIFTFEIPATTKEGEN
jgi:signal transduction histidine kinase